MKEVDTTHAQNELAEAAKSCAEAELANTRDDLKNKTRSFGCRTGAVCFIQQEDAQAAEGRAESGLCKIRDDLLLIQRVLAAERERSEIINEKAQESDKHLEKLRAAQEELRTSREALATEREL